MFLFYHEINRYASIFFKKVKIFFISFFQELEFGEIWGVAHLYNQGIRYDEIMVDISY